MRVVLELQLKDGARQNIMLSLFRTPRQLRVDSFVSSRSLSGSLTLVCRLPRNGGDSRRAVNGRYKRAHNGDLL